MKKIISIALALLLLFSLCACGSVDIGPLTFHFGGNTDTGSASADSGWSGSNATDAPAVEAPAEEIPPIEAGEADIDFGDFTVDFHGGIIGEFSDRGVTASLTNEGYSPYLIVTFTYTDYSGRGDMYIDHILVGENLYPILDPNDNPDHFVNNIDRYFGYDYAFESAALDRNGQVKAFACFRLDEMAMVMLEAGEPCYIGFNGNLIESNFTRNHAEMIDEILIFEEEYGYPYDISHACATFLWSLDFSHYLIEQIRINTEEHGESGIWENYAAPELLMNIYNTENSMSPAVTPNFNGEFQTGFGPMPFYLEMASEKYPEIVEMAHEYTELCIVIADAAMYEGNYDVIIELSGHANELYQIIAWSLADGHGVELQYIQ
ncbi:MAG: hypothetical protein IJ017_07970 [Oscillospiraceae bacterium]|nr:hypothetical protein [Oscillospiraceae bacterium]